jgi:hypothetical protein
VGSGLRAWARGYVRGLGVTCVDAIATNRQVRQAAIINGLLGAWLGYLANTSVCGFRAMYVNMVE